MEPTLVSELKSIKRSLAHLIFTIEPENEDEWNVHEKIEAAHKLFRSIEFSKLGQIPLPEPKDPEVECPMCSGRGTMKDGTGADALCAECGGVGKVKTSALQLEAFDKMESAIPATPSGNGTGEAVVAVFSPAETPRRRGRPRKSTVLEEAAIRGKEYNEAAQRQKDFEDGGKGIDTDNDCAPD